MTTNTFWKEYVLSNGGAKFRIEIRRDGEHVARRYFHGTLDSVASLFSSIFKPEDGYSLEYYPVRSRA